MNSAHALAVFLIAIFVLGSPTASHAQSADLRVLQVQFENLLGERVTDVYNASLAKLDAGYLAGVERGLADAKAAGDLPGALSLDEELKRIASKGELPINDEKAADSLRKLRGIYRAELAKLNGQRASGQSTLLTPYIAKLRQLEADLTKADRLAEAKAVMDYRQGLDAGMPARIAVAPVTSKPLTPPATPQVPASAPAATSSAGAIEVAGEIKAKSGAKNAAAGVIAFDCPPGDGRRGAKGILLPNDLLTGKNGTTWSLTYSRKESAYGLQIIHPHGSGQVIIHVQKDKIGISAPKSWTEAGYGAGDTKKVRNSRGFNEIFPLKDGEAYQMVSKLDAQGGYELAVNGKVVATARVNNTSPLSFEIKPDTKFQNSGGGELLFKGDNFPMQWAAGYAAILLGPLDKGENVCRDVRFWPAVTK